VAICGYIHQTTPPVPDGVYVLTNQSSKMALDDPAASKVFGQAIWQYPPDGVLEQKWFLSFNGSGFYTIQNVASKLFLTDPNRPPTPGEPLEQEAPDNSDNQLWSLTASGSGYILTNKLSGLVIDDLNANPASGANIGLATRTNAADQVWTIQ
jgi:hypothetical protein